MLDNLSPPKVDKEKACYVTRVSNKKWVCLKPHICKNSKGNTSQIIYFFLTTC
jgi:hypothetical protein